MSDEWPITITGTCTRTAGTVHYQHQQATDRRTTWHVAPPRGVASSAGEQAAVCLFARFNTLTRAPLVARRTNERTSTISDYRAPLAASRLAALPSRRRGLHRYSTVPRTVLGLQAVELFGAFASSVRHVSVPAGSNPLLETCMRIASRVCCFFHSRLPVPPGPVGSDRGSAEHATHRAASAQRVGRFFSCRGSVRHSHCHYTKKYSRAFLFLCKASFGETNRRNPVYTTSIPYRNSST